MSSDLEKGSPSLQSVSQSDLENTPTSELKDPLPESKPQSTWQRLISVLKGGGETRGIEPVPLEERQAVTASTSLHMLLMWFSMTLATNNIIVGSIGTFVLGLSFKDAALCAVFGNLLGVCTVGYVSTWGPVSGNRTLVNSNTPWINFKITRSSNYRSWAASLWDTTPAKFVVRSTFSPILATAWSTASLAVKSCPGFLADISPCSWES